MKPVFVALALVLLAQAALAQAANATAAATASAEYGRSRSCRRGESWCDGRCCGASWFHYQRHHCGRVRDVRERPGLGKGGL